jgi:hypothetical protein
MISGSTGRSTPLLRAMAGALVLLASVALGAPAAAQPGDLERLGREAGSLRLEVIDLQGIVTDEQPMHARVRVVNGGRSDRDDLRIVAAVHRETIGRFAFQQAMDDDVVGNIIHPFVADLDPVPGRGGRTVDLVQTADELGLARPGQDGVYPLRLQLLAGGEVADEVTTAIVVIPAHVEHPLSVALLLPLALPPQRDAEGVVTDRALLHSLGPHGSLAGTVAALTSAEDLGATIAVDPLTLRDTAELTDGFALREAGVVVVGPADSAAAERATALLAGLTDVVSRPGTEHLALPYGGADLVALVRTNQREVADRSLADAVTEVEAHTGARPTGQILLPPAGLDTDTLEQVRGNGVTTVVLSEQWLRIGARGDRSPSPVRRLRAGRNATTVLVPDPWLEQPLSTSSVDGPAVGAQRIIGELASVYFERPGTARRGLLLAPQPDEAVPSSLLAALAEPLSTTPIFSSVPMTTLVRATAPDETPVALDYPAEARQRELPLTYMSLLAGARRALGSLSGVAEGDTAMAERFDRILMQSSSVHYRGEDMAEGRALMRTVTDTIADIYGSVRVVDNPPVTLTAVSGQVPVSVRSDAAIPLRVRITLTSPRYEVEGGPTREVVLQPQTTEILTFGVRALSPGGTSPIQVVISDVEGTLDLARGRVVVRSTAFSIVGLVVVAGAGVFLIGWLLREVSRRRRTPAVHGHGAGERRPVAVRQARTHR